MTLTIKLPDMAQPLQPKPGSPTTELLTAALSDLLSLLADAVEQGYDREMILDRIFDTVKSSARDEPVADLALATIAQALIDSIEDGKT